MPLTAMEVFEKANDADVSGDTAEAITLFQAAEQLFNDEGSPEDAETCIAMVEILSE